MDTIIGSKDAFQRRTQLVDSVMPAAIGHNAGNYHHTTAGTLSAPTAIYVRHTCQTIPSLQLICHSKQHPSLLDVRA